MIPLLRRNDPIINSVNMSLIDLSDEMTDQFIDALNVNTFISRVVLQANKLSTGSAMKIFDLLLSNPKLVHIEITENGLDNDAIQHLSGVLLRLPPEHEPISVILRKNSFGPVGVSYLAEALRANVPVHYLDLRYNADISDPGVEELAISLVDNTVLTGLDLIKCGCDQLGAAALRDALQENHTLTTLLLQDTLSFSAVKCLGTLLADPSCHLQALYLWHCSLNPALIDVLCRALKTNNCLTTLALSYNQIDDLGALSLSDMILTNRALVKLHLGANKFSVMTAGYFGVALAKNSTLQYLDLSRNCIRSVGVWPLAVSLMDNKSLRSIDLRYNKIDAEGIDKLCELIGGNSAISVMRLSGNPFGDIAIEKLVIKLTENKTLRELELNEVRMRSSGFIALCRALAENSTLQRLSINGNTICEQSETMAKFGALLSMNATLQMIGMSECGIDSFACQYIARGIQHNANLSELILSKNRIDLRGATDILDAILGNYSLVKIDLQVNPFQDVHDSEEVSGRIADSLERNNYYYHNILMRDLAGLVSDHALF
jgi:Ran GTPase-activating protein (RanGAP) involved in mRNA processing and transport